MRLYQTYLTAVHVLTTKQSPKCRLNSHFNSSKTGGGGGGAFEALQHFKVE